MQSSTNQTDPTQQSELENNTWEPKAWVYFVWVVMGQRVYCKIGYSTNPGSRFNQITVGIPERPFKIHLLPCLNVEQAKLFEKMFHDHLREFKSKASGEWFTHPNVRQFYRILKDQLEEILCLFRSFGYESELQGIDMDGKWPVS